MTPKKISPRGLFLWRIRIALLAFLPAFFSFYFYYPGELVWQILTGLWLAAFLAMYFIYYPVKYRKLSYGFNRRSFVLNCGVIYTRIKSAYLENVQYVALTATPLQRALGLATVFIVVPGGTMFVPGLAMEEAVILRDRICSGKEAEG